MISINESGREAIQEAFMKIETSPEFGHMADEIHLRFHEALGKLALRSDHIEIRGGYCKIGSWVDGDETKTWLEIEFRLVWINKETGKSYMIGGMNWSETQKSFSVNT